jgi:hypothetical protein
MSGKPLLLVDVDGVISLFGFDPCSPPAGVPLALDGTLHLISAAAGDHLRRLQEAFEPVWCTAWQEQADRHLRALLGLPRWPWISFEGHRPAPQASWKLAAIDAWAGPQRPLAWIDDAHDDRCERWAAGRAGPTLLLRTEPAVGLTAAHLAAALRWARGLRQREGDRRRTMTGGPGKTGD